MGLTERNACVKELLERPVESFDPSPNDAVVFLVRRDKLYPGCGWSILVHFLGPPNHVRMRNAVLLGRLSNAKPQDKVSNDSRLLLGAMCRG